MVGYQKMAVQPRPLALLLRDADGGEEYAEALHRVGCDAAFVPVLSFAPRQCDALDGVSAGLEGRGGGRGGITRPAPRTTARQWCDSRNVYAARYPTTTTTLSRRPPLPTPTHRRSGHSHAAAPTRAWC